MRSFILILALMVVSCAEQKPPLSELKSDLAPGFFAGKGRDGLCISAAAEVQRAGFIVYGTDNRNCAATGRIEGAPKGRVFVPDGEGPCRIPLALQGVTATLGPAAAGCTYYCAPGVSFEGKSFRKSEAAQMPTDAAGDPLC